METSPGGIAQAGVIFFWSVPIFDCARSARLSPDERLDKIPAILPVGLLRLDQRAALPAFPLLVATCLPVIAMAGRA